MTFTVSYKESYMSLLLFQTRNGEKCGITVTLLNKSYAARTCIVSTTIHGAVNDNNYYSSGICLSIKPSFEAGSEYTYKYK